MMTLYLIVALVSSPATGERGFELSARAYQTEEACEAVLPKVLKEYEERGLKVEALGCAATLAGGLSA